MSVYALYLIGHKVFLCNIYSKTWKIPLFWFLHNNFVCSVNTALQACKLVANVVNKLRKPQYMFQSKRIWLVCTTAYCEIEWEELCGGMSVLKKIDLWLNVKFLVKFRKIEAKIDKMLSIVYGEDVLKPAKVYKWMKRLQEGSEDVGDDMWSSCPSSSCTEENVDRIHMLALPNQWIMTKQLAEGAKMITRTYPANSTNKVCPVSSSKYSKELEWALPSSTV